MTNAEAAAYFASLPQDEEAEIVLYDADTDFASFETLNKPGEFESENQEIETAAFEAVSVIRKW